MNTHVPILNITVGGLLSRVTLIFITILWTLPTLGLFISSLRDKDQLIVSGWWTALSSTTQNNQGRMPTAEDQEEIDGMFVLSGSLFEEGTNRSVASFGGGGFIPGEVDTYQPGEAVQVEYTVDVLPEGANEDAELVEEARTAEFVLNADGTYQLTSETPFELDRGQRFFYVAAIPPTFTLENYREVLTSEGIGQAFINTFTVTIPATLIPIAIAAFASYAFSWMEFPGRQLLFAIVVGLLVVPLQMSLIPLLQMYNNVGSMFNVNAQSYPGVWLAHTGFGLPLAIYLLRNYIGSLPRELIESAKIDGASHFDIFIRLILPLSIPALASFAIFQFLWVWNDLLVALVFLGRDPNQIVLTSKLRELLGSRADNWEILTSSAFVSIIVPLLVFFSLQRYFVRGLLAGSVKGG